MTSPNDPFDNNVKKVVKVYQMPAHSLKAWEAREKTGYYLAHNFW